MSIDQNSIHPTTSQLILANRWDHILARWAINRNEHRVEPGLYALGRPAPESPVLVTANYTLSFDTLRSALPGVDAYILVLDTQGINVWCAAGKGTFGTDELVHRIEETGLKEIVSHRNLILPQLGAPGVAGFEVTKRTGFKVKYGPVRAADLPRYLQSYSTTPEMRRVTFTLADRITLIPVELAYALIPLLIVTILLRSKPAAAAILAGTVLFPILLPWIPTHNFSTKGFILGAVITLPFVLATWQRHSEFAWWLRSGEALAAMLAFPAVTAYLALNFTGSTTFTSRSGVRSEIFKYVPAMAWMFGIGIVLMVILSFVKA
ncbi:MAG: carbon monoxide dehydrogenase [Chloroflexota bacterium]|nr:MAG: carbon monoxide dehydrogenase [Chloroflexota bacterium]